jgi:hypothetical protein
MHELDRGVANIRSCDESSKDLGVRKSSHLARDIPGEIWECRVSTAPNRPALNGTIIARSAHIRE